MRTKFVVAVTAAFAVTLTLVAPTAVAAVRRQESVATVTRVVQADLGKTKTVSVNARVTPRATNSIVRLQLKNGTRWVVVDSDRADRNGRVRLSKTVGEGNFALRVFAPSTRRAKAAVSRIVRVANPLESGTENPTDPTDPPLPELTLEEAQQEILSNVNEYRASYGSPPVELDLIQSQGAQDQAEDFARLGTRPLAWVGDYIRPYEEPVWYDVTGCYGPGSHASNVATWDFDTDYMRPNLTHLVIGYAKREGGPYWAHEAYSVTLYLVEQR